MHTLKEKKQYSNHKKYKLKLSYALHIITVIFVSVYLTSVCGVLVAMAPLQKKGVIF